MNVVVGSWIGATLLLNLLIIATCPKRRRRKDDIHDLMLVEDCHSPVGFTVPTFPSFTIDPTRAMKALPLVSVEHEMYSSVFLAILLMGLMLSLAFAEWTKTIERFISDRFQDLFP